MTVRQVFHLWMCATAFAAVARAQAPSESLKRFLQDYLKDPEDKTIRLSTASADLNDDGKTEIVVYVTGRDWCGTGGCTLLILDPKDSTYNVVGDTTITRPPIRLLSTKSNRWHDISVWVVGGGIQPGYEAKLSFDGSTYPSNPSTPPAVPLRTKGAGKVLISDREKGFALY